MVQDDDTQPATKGDVRILKDDIHEAKMDMFQIKSSQQTLELNVLRLENSMLLMDSSFKDTNEKAYSSILKTIDIKN